MNDMTFELYHLGASSTAVYPGRGTQRGLEYCTMGLMGEAGELANKVKKLMRGDQELTSEVCLNLGAEAADVLWYLDQLAFELGIPLADLAEANIIKLKKRALEGKIKGDGDNR